MFLYLVYIVPFLDMLRRQQIGSLVGMLDEPPDHILFGQMGRAYDAAKITKVLRNASRVLWGTAAGLTLYRQVSIGIAEKHVREIISPTNIYDDRSVDADLNVAISWQSAHRPLQRGTTYGLDGAYPSQLQPSLLRAYEWASTRWHEFLHQPSKKLPTVLYPKASRKRKAENSGGLDSSKRQVPNSNTGSHHDLLSEAIPVSQSQPRLYGERMTGLCSTKLGEFSISDYVTFVSDYRIILCTQCKSAIKAGQGIERHLREHRFTGSLLRCILDYCSLRDIRDPSEIPHPIDGSKPILGLRCFVGFSCTSCRYLTIARDGMTRHWRMAPHGKDTATNLAKREQWKMVMLQSWLQGRYVKYWIVCEKGIGPSSE